MNPELYTDRGMYLDYLSQYIEHQDETEKVIMKEIFEQWEIGIYDHETIKNRLCMKFPDIRTRKINKAYKDLISYIYSLEKESKPSLDSDRYYFQQIYDKVLKRCKKNIDTILRYVEDFLDDVNQKELSPTIKNKIREDIPWIIRNRTEYINTYYLDDDLKKHFYSKCHLVYQKLLCRITGQLLELVDKKITEEQLLQEQREMEEAKGKEAIRKKYSECFKDFNQK